MATTFTIKKGLEANLPALVSGEPAFTTDTNKLYIGSGNGNIEFAKQLVRKNYKKSSLAHPGATANTNGTPIVLLPQPGYSSLNPLAVDVVYSGNFQVESVTAFYTAVYSDSTAMTITKVATASQPTTATTTSSFTNTDLINLIKDDVYITRIEVCAQSNIDASAVEITFNHCGIYL